MLRFRILSSACMGLFVLSGCGFEAEQPGAPTSVDGAGTTTVETSLARSDATSTQTVVQGRGADRATCARAEELSSGSADRVSHRSSDYELMSVRRDGWDVYAQVLTPRGLRDVHYSLRLDGERGLYTGEVRNGADIVWRQSFDVAIDGSRVDVEETDGFDLLRFEVITGDRENYTLVLGDGGVRHYSVAVGAEDWEGWAEFWPSTGLDWNPDAALCNGLAKGRILRDEVDAGLRSSASIGDPQYMHPLIEQLCALIDLCTAMKCRAGGIANELCLDCLGGSAVCELLRLIFG